MKMKGDKIWRFNRQNWVIPLIFYIYMFFGIIGSLITDVNGLESNLKGNLLIIIILLLKNLGILLIIPVLMSYLFDNSTNQEEPTVKKTVQQTITFDRDEKIVIKIKEANSDVIEIDVKTR